VVHIVDGALSAQVVVGATALAIGGVAMGLKSIDVDRVPRVGLLGAVFFVASLVHVPVGPASTHLILAGLIGILLGWAAFPAIFIGVLLQAVLFGFGGLTVLGVNTLNVALPALLCYVLCASGIRNGAAPATVAAWGFVAGTLSVALVAFMVAFSLVLSGEAFIVAAKLVVLAHVPVAIVEGFLTAAAVVLIRKVKPELFDAPVPWEKGMEHA
jgi:cobalt/nickel transport system permease protein